MATEKVIVAKANAGTPFDKLSDQYTMDGNKTHGTVWFFGEWLPKISRMQYPNTKWATSFVERF